MFPSSANSPLPGTIPHDTATYPCPTISKQPFINSNILRPNARNMPPHSWSKPNYGLHVQYAPDDNFSPLLPPKTINLVQKIVGTLLYYSIAVNPTMLATLSYISTQKTKGT